MPLVLAGAAAFVALGFAATQVNKTARIAVLLGAGWVVFQLVKR